MIGGLENRPQIWKSSTHRSGKVNSLPPGVELGVVEKMSRRRFASFLFMVALLAQIASPLARGAAMAMAAADGATTGAAYCHMLAGEDSAAPAARTLSEQAPDSDRACHDHDCCPLCQSGSGAAPLLRFAAPAAAAPWSASTRLVYSAHVRPVGSLRLNRAAQARAPPSLV